MSTLSHHEEQLPQPDATSFEALIATRANQGLEHTGEVRGLSNQIEDMVSKYGKTATDPQDDEAKYLQTPFQDVAYSMPRKDDGEPQAQEMLRIAYRSRTTDDSFDQTPTTYNIIIEGADGRVMPFATIVGTSLSLLGLEEKNNPEHITKVSKLVRNYNSQLIREMTSVTIHGHSFTRRGLIGAALLLPIGIALFKGCEGVVSYTSNHINDEPQEAIDFDERNTKLDNPIEVRTNSSMKLTETKGLKERLDVAQDIVPTLYVINEFTSDYIKIIRLNDRKLKANLIRQVIFAHTTAQQYPTSKDTTTVANIELQQPITNENAYLRVWTDAVDDNGNSVADKLRVAFTSNSVRVAWEGGDIGISKPRVLLQVIDQ